ncbi:Hint domain-containing protein [Sedimentitalea sp. XS_ASV28]|uniref:Hint domain-containing protein n=1 Tax=Sedimentitalea sp. XS_ASV28 TaxID=3241296 RepID=UPI003513EE92
MPDPTGINFSGTVYAYTLDMFTFTDAGGATISSFPTGGTSSSGYTGAETIALKTGEAPGELDVEAPDTPNLVEGEPTMTGTGTVSSTNETVTFDGSSSFEPVNVWDFTGSDGAQYWISEIVQDGQSLYLTNYSFEENVALDLVGHDTTAGFRTSSTSDYDSPNGAIGPQNLNWLLISDVTTPGAPSENALGYLTYRAWDPADFTLNSGQWTLASTAVAGTFTTYDNDNYFSDGIANYSDTRNDTDQIGDASVGSVSATGQIYQAEAIRVVEDANGNRFQVITISFADGSSVLVSTNELQPGESYDNILNDGTPGGDNVNRTDAEEQSASYATLVVCFAYGTRIETESGEKSVEELAIGDLVKTRDNGFQPIRWIRHQTVDLRSLQDPNRFQPVRIRAGALGRGMPKRDLYVSQQHRILIKSRIARRMIGDDEVLVPANKLLDIEGIDMVTECDEVTYVHFLFDQHELVYANAAETESLYTGPQALKAVGPEARDEILALFPDLAEVDYDAPPVRTIVSGKQARVLAVRHALNNKSLYLA